MRFEITAIRWGEDRDDTGSLRTQISVNQCSEQEARTGEVECSRAEFHRETRVESMNQGAPRICIFGYYGMRNFGNDASFHAILGELRRRRPNAKISTACHDPNVFRETLQIEGVRIDSGRLLPWGEKTGGIWGRLVGILRKLKLPKQIAIWWNTLRFLRSVDELLIGGTGILDDFGTSPRGLPYDLLRWCISARLCRVKILFVSAGAGPIRNPLSRRMMLWACRLAAYRSYRDEYSRDYMGGVGLDVRHDSVYPDLAFALPPPPQPPARVDDRVVVAVGIMAYIGWGNEPERADEIQTAWYSRMVAMIEGLLGHGYRVRVVIGDASDNEAVDAILAELRRRRVQTDDIKWTPLDGFEAVRCAINEADVVVAARFHNILFSLMQAKPTISLAYSEKNTALMKAMGLPEYCYSLESFDPGTVVDAVDGLVRVREEVSEKLRAAAARQREAMTRQLDYLFPMLT